MLAMRDPREKWRGDGHSISLWFRHRCCEVIKLAFIGLLVYLHHPSIKNNNMINTVCICHRISVVSCSVQRDDYRTMPPTWPTYTKRPRLSTYLERRGNEWLEPVWPSVYRVFHTCNCRCLLVSLLYVSSTINTTF